MPARSAHALPPPPLCNVSLHGGPFIICPCSGGAPGAGWPGLGLRAAAARGEGGEHAGDSRPRGPRRLAAHDPGARLPVVSCARACVCCVCVCVCFCACVCTCVLRGVYPCLLCCGGEGGRARQAEVVVAIKGLLVARCRCRRRVVLTRMWQCALGCQSPAPLRPARPPIPTPRITQCPLPRVPHCRQAARQSAGGKSRAATHTADATA